MALVNFLVGLAAYFVAGILAAKQTAKVSTGTFAGMWAGGLNGVIGMVVNGTLFFMVNLPRVLNLTSTNPTYAANPDGFRAGVIGGGVGFLIFGLFFAIGLGAGLGALGGLIGKNTSKLVATPPYPAQPYPGQGNLYPSAPYQSYPGQQPYPGQPYPGQLPKPPYYNQ